jgi:leucyl aminopeptidase
MPIIGTVTALNRADLGTAGAYLHAAADGGIELADFVVAPVGAGGSVAADAALDALLPAGAAQTVSAAELTGKAGQFAQVAARVGDATVRIVFLGVGDRSPSALRRAGGELGRLLQPGNRAVSSVVAGQPYEQVRAFAEGVLLGCYRYSEKSAVTAGQAKDAELTLLVPGAAGDDGSPAGQADGGSVAAIGEAVIFATAVALARSH